MNFEEYLHNKKIDSEAFFLKRPEEWERNKFQFEGSGPVAFDQHKKFLINDWRIDFPLKKTGEDVLVQTGEKPAVPKRRPMFRKSIHDDLNSKTELNLPEDESAEKESSEEKANVNIPPAFLQRKSFLKETLNEEEKKNKKSPSFGKGWQGRKKKSEEKNKNDEQEK